ncbi:hypothetical protein BC937DRAFT_94065 [Endogone sp. FLAS-F59071]|nr:hypothetical protein BC937DRAFT_94065 [Endogone sp. FLAS-F59071]|eukprot:RUS14273.1 hypothetical protein BC937DRAFT_94065 [Endogone sp. FLAS-F59071]
MEPLAVLPHSSSTMLPVLSPSNSSTTRQRKSVRFSRFERLYYTHSSWDYDRTSIVVKHEPFANVTAQYPLLPTSVDPS